MWWRFLIFCILVTIILFIVLSSIHGRPVTQSFFHRCCEENIENDKMIFEDFGNTNTLRERLIGEGILFLDNSSFVSEEDVQEVINVMRDKFNVHDPKSRVNSTLIEVIQDEVLNENEASGEFTTKRTFKNDLDIKSERLTDVKDKIIEEFEINEERLNSEDPIQLFNKETKASDAISKLDILVNDNDDDGTRIRLSAFKLSTNSVEGSIANTAKSTDIMNLKRTTVFEDYTVIPEIKLAPPLDDMIMTDMQDSNDSVEF